MRTQTPTIIFGLDQTKLTKRMLLNYSMALTLARSAKICTPTDGDALAFQMNATSHNMYQLL